MYSEAERQGEMLAFYGEEDARNYDSPEPGPLVEKDDAAVKSTDAADNQVRFQCLIVCVILCT